MSRVAAIVLAAGGSARLGEPKQLLQYRGRALVRHAAEMALEAGCNPTIVVLGANADACSAELDKLPVEVAVNPNWSTGISSSIRVGLVALQQYNEPMDAVLFTLCDQPRLCSRSLAGIIEKYRASGARIVASAYAETLGVPALFARELFSELHALRGDAGARIVIAAHLAEVVSVPNDQAALDIDTPADRAHLAGND